MAGKKKSISALKSELEAKKTELQKKFPSKNKTGKSTVFHGARQSSTDPFTNIITQHNQSRMRSFKTILIIFVVALVFVAASFLYHDLSSSEKRLSRLNKITEELKYLDGKIQQSSGYEKALAAIKAIYCTENASSFDIKNFRKWFLEREKYRNFIFESNQGEVKSGENFVNPMSLIDMVYIPKGRFYMGRGAMEAGRPEELPRHAVIISSEFWISRTEISNYQLRTLFPNHINEKWNNYVLDASLQPAVKVNWHVASGFCRMLTDAGRKSGMIPAGYEYRLPTEAEWEYACRAGTETIYFWGNGFGRTGAEFANSLDKYSARLFNWKEGPDMAPSDGYQVSAPVASYKSNAFGLYDMSGNAWEWCLDWYNPDAYRMLSETDPYQNTPLVVPLEKRKSFDAGTYTIESTCKVIRGGSWGNLPLDCRSAKRDYTVPEEQDTGIGFRVVLAPVFKTN